MPRSKNTATAMAIQPGNDKETHSYEVKQIENGFLLRHSVSGNGKYETKETYHPTLPKMAIGPPPAPKKASTMSSQRPLKAARVPSRPKK